MVSAVLNGRTSPRENSLSIPSGWNAHKHKDRIELSHHKVAGRTQSRSPRCNEGIITKTTNKTLTDHAQAMTALSLGELQVFEEGSREMLQTGSGGSGIPSAAGRARGGQAGSWVRALARHVGNHQKFMV